MRKPHVKCAAEPPDHLFRWQMIVAIVPGNLSCGHSLAAGHSSWSSSGLSYLSWFVAGKLRCFDGSAHPWRLVAAFLPMLGAIWIGITRLQAMPDICPCSSSLDACIC